MQAIIFRFVLLLTIAEIAARANDPSLPPQHLDTAVLEPHSS